MKRFIFAVLLMGLFVIFMEPAGNLLSSLLRLEQPLSHEIKEGDWLSKIALQYYGDTSYWKELALVNRAPDGDLIFPGEKIVVPSFEAIQKVRTSRRLSDVNAVVDLQQDILAGRVKAHSEPLAKRAAEAPNSPTPETAEKQIAPQASESPAFKSEPYKIEAGNGADTSFWLSTPVVTGVVVLAVLLVMGVFLYVRKKKREEVEFYGSAPKAEEDEKKSAYFFDDDEDARRKNGAKKEKNATIVS